MQKILMAARLCRTREAIRVSAILMLVVTIALPAAAWAASHSGGNGTNQPMAAPVRRAPSLAPRPCPECGVAYGCHQWCRRNPDGTTQCGWVCPKRP